MAVNRILATLFFAARVYARAWLLRNWSWDDTFLTISWIGSVVLVLFSCIATKYGAGHHIWDIPLDLHKFATPALRIAFGGSLVYQATLALTKISICLFYLRLFSDKTTRYLCYITISFICLYTIPTLAFGIFQCWPVEGYWEILIPSKCHSPVAAFYTSGICNILTDAWLIAIVVPRIWNLKMGKKEKAALFSIITMSWLVIIAAIIRMARLSIVMRTQVQDMSWSFYDVSIWPGLEVAMGIFCVSAPAIKPIFKEFAPGMFSSISSSLSNSKDRYFRSSRISKAAISRQDRWSLKNGGAIELPDQDERQGNSSFVTELRISHNQVGVGCGGRRTWKQLLKAIMAYLSWVSPLEVTRL